MHQYNEFIKNGTSNSICRCQLAKLYSLLTVTKTDYALLLLIIETELQIACSSIGLRTVVVIGARTVRDVGDRSPTDFWVWGTTTGWSPTDFRQFRNFINAFFSRYRRSFSALKRLKTYLRNTMSPSRLNACAVLHVHHHETERLCAVDVLREFSARNAARKEHFGETVTCCLASA
jgi:hypothetical protein